MPRGKAQDTTSIEVLEMALVGYRMRQQELEERIREMRGRSEGAATKQSAAKTAGGREEEPRRRRTLSASARKRIAIAQKKRWAEHRKQLAASGKSE